jgi:hypothetical protein
MPEEATESGPTELEAREETSPVETGGLEDTEAGPEETARLKRLVAENERAALHSTLAEFDLRQRLADAELKYADVERKHAELEIQLQARSTGTTDFRTSASGKSAEAGDAVSAADVARLKADWHRAMKALEQENRERKSELVLAKGQLHQTQRQLEHEYAGRKGEAAKRGTNIVDLEAELEEWREAATKSNLSQSRRQSMRGNVAIVVAAAGAIALAVAIWTIYAKPVPACAAAEPEPAAIESATGKARGPASPTAAPAQTAETFSLPGITQPATTQGNGPEVRQDRGLAGGMDRLNSALAAFSGRQPEDILREIHRKAAKTDPSLCAFNWNNGQPAILYGGGGKLSLSATIDKCAAAIEKYH